MSTSDSFDRRAVAAADFNAHENRDDGEKVVNSLYYGLSTLRNLLFTRVHHDVERLIGRDSILMPLSPGESEQRTKLEIEFFQVAVSTVEARDCGHVADIDWYGDWLLRLRLPGSRKREVGQKRVARYLEMDEEQRRLGFSRVLEKTFPEATRAPLILYRLFPASVGIVTAMAWNHSARVDALREQQVNDLPPIRDCHVCRGRPLDNGEQCQTCGNPIWTYEWLTAAD
jgi:hypothetical protein